VTCACTAGAHWTRAARLLAAVAVLACERTPQPAVDTSATDTSAPVRTPDRPAEWATELGPALLVPADSEQTAMLLYPSNPGSALSSAGRFSLFSSGGDSMSAQGRLVVSDSQVCGEAPTVRLVDSVPHPWTIGLLARHAPVLPMDSIEAIPSADSTRMVADLARLASSLPGGTDARFVGLPFVVVSARRFTAAGRQFIVAHFVRRLPQEATPLEERVFLIGEREAGGTAPYTVAYHLRSAGTEETADHYDVLAAFRGDSSVYLAITRDQDARTSYELLERSRTGWRVRWTRTLEC
jgi:hypothetical protein